MYFSLILFGNEKDSLKGKFEDDIILSTSKSTTSSAENANDVDTLDLSYVNNSDSSPSSSPASSSNNNTDNDSNSFSSEDVSNETLTEFFNQKLNSVLQ